MKRTISLIAAGAIAFGPTLATAGPVRGSMPTAPHMSSPMTAPTPSTTTAPGNGQINGTGYNHMNGPTTTGQPSQDCEELIASGTGSDPGNSASSGHSAFGGSAGDVYAGSQPQNSRNTASVSQYDVACANQPH